MGPKIEALEARTLLIAQIESVEGLANAEAIAAVEGIDVLWVGHFDLTVSMGIPGAFGDPRFLAAMARVAGAAAGRGLAAGFNVDTVEAGHEWIAQASGCSPTRRTSGSWRGPSPPASTGCGRPARDEPARMRAGRPPPFDREAPPLPHTEPDFEERSRPCRDPGRPFDVKGAPAHRRRSNRHRE